MKLNETQQKALEAIKEKFEKDSAKELQNWGEPLQFASVPEYLMDRRRIGTLRVLAERGFIEFRQNLFNVRPI